MCVEHELMKANMQFKDVSDLPVVFVSVQLKLGLGTLLLFCFQNSLELKIHIGCSYVLHKLAVSWSLLT